MVIYDVFVSYKHHDNNEYFVNLVVYALQQRGLTVFLDRKEYDINRKLELLPRVKESTCLLLVVSRLVFTDDGQWQHDEVSSSSSPSSSPSSPPSFGQCQLRRRTVMQTPERVQRLVDAVTARRLQVQGTMGGGSGPGVGEVEVAPWDVSHHHMMAAARLSPVDWTAVAHFFPLHGVLEGLRLIIADLFDCALVEQPIGAEEDWSTSLSSSSSSSSSSSGASETEGEETRVRKFHVVDQATDTLQGVIYLDLFAREGKSATCAEMLVLHHSNRM